MLRLFLCLTLLITTCSFLITSCGDSEELVEREDGFNDYVSVYNQYISGWVSEELKKEKRKLKEIESRLIDSPKDKDLLAEKSDLVRVVNKHERRVGRGDYFQVKSSSELPDDIKWTSGEKQPEIGDSRAKKGGVMTDYTSDFPPTLRRFGPNSNHQMRGLIYQDIELLLVHPHPVTEKPIPGVAVEWALANDGYSLFYRIDPDAKYNDDVKIEAIDYLYRIYYMTSNNVKEPYYKQLYRESFAGFTAYGDDVLEVILTEPGPRTISLTPKVVIPAPKHFYKNYGPDFEKRYNWKVAPTAGPYFVKDEDINKGVSITLTRNENWWAKDKRYYRYRYNADKIKYQYVRDPAKAIELFKVGYLDYLLATSPRIWYEKTEVEPVFNGYIEKYKFYNQYARVPRGFYLNHSKGFFKDKNVRLGFLHSVHWQKIIDTTFRGDFGRLEQFFDGFGMFTDSSLKAREFSSDKARESFAEAGFTITGADGVLEKEDGTRLALEISYANSTSTGKMMATLKEEALKCGVDLVLDALEGTAFYEKVMKKEHMSTYWGWGSEPPFPSGYQFFHSKNAVDSKGNPKPNTNNINSYVNPKIDPYLVAMRNARTEAEYRDAVFKVQHIVYEDAIFSAAFKTEYTSVACWRWVRWPQSEDTPVSFPIIRYLFDSYVWWIDEGMKEETKEAMRSGRTYEEVQIVEDAFKEGIPEKYRQVND